MFYSFQCQLCGFKDTAESNYKKHLLTHSGESRGSKTDSSIRRGLRRMKPQYDSDYSHQSLPENCDIYSILVGEGEKESRKDR